MARQVVSYDDLDAPSAVSLQTTLAKPVISTSVSTATQLHPAGGTAPNASASPPTKRRKRDEEVTLGTGIGNVGSSGDVRVIEGAGTGSDSAQSPASFQPLAPKPPVKRRGGRHRRRSGGGTSAVPGNAARGGATMPVQHWDDPGVQALEISYDKVGSAGVEETKTKVYSEEGGWVEGEGDGNMDIEDEDEEDEDVESRELTHEEIWDDSALIVAWNAATEEYEAMNGKNKRWKKERVHKSPLWYNIPPEKPINKNKGEGNAKQGWLESGSSAAMHSPHQQVLVQALSGAVDDNQESSVPLDFDSYVPMHDASLAFTAPPKPASVPEATQSQLDSITSHYATTLPGLSTGGSVDARVSPDTISSGAGGIGSVSADEAFSRAAGAMYWCGYWTAVYHMQRVQEACANDGENDAQVQEEEETEMLVSTQR